MRFRWMPPPAKRSFGQASCRNRAARGLLLVEAVLAAVVIGISLTLITRGLGSQLRALRTVRDQATLLRLAQGVLLVAQQQVHAGQVPEMPQQGEFDEPDVGYAWTWRAEPSDTEDLGVPVSRVRLVVRPAGQTAGGLTLGTVWPTELVPPEWL